MHLTPLVQEVLQRKQHQYVPWHVQLSLLEPALLRQVVPNPHLCMKTSGSNTLPCPAQTCTPPHTVAGHTEPAQLRPCNDDPQAQQKHVVHTIQRWAATFAATVNSQTSAA